MYAWFWFLVAVALLIWAVKLSTRLTAEKGAREAAHAKFLDLRIFFKSTFAALVHGQPSQIFSYLTDPKLASLLDDEETLLMLAAESGMFDHFSAQELMVMISRAEQMFNNLPNKYSPKRIQVHLALLYLKRLIKETLKPGVTLDDCLGMYEETNRYTFCIPGRDEAQLQILERAAELAKEYDEFMRLVQLSERLPDSYNFRKRLIRLAAESTRGESLLGTAGSLRE